MSRKHFSSALLISVLTLPFLYLLVTRASTLGMTMQLVSMIALVFAASLMTTWLSMRPVSTASRNKKSRSSKSQDKPARPSTPVGPRESGQVKWFNASKGFGFITRDNGEDIFVHFRSIRGDGHRILKDGQRVEFSVSMGDKGLQADDVAATSL